MIQIFGHESVAAALETQYMPPCGILHHLMIAAIFNYTDVEGRIEGRFTPAYAPQPYTSGQIVVEFPGEVRFGIQTLLVPAIKAVKTELATVERRVWGDVVCCAQLSRGSVHFRFGRKLKKRGIRAAQHYAETNASTSAGASAVFAPANRSDSAGIAFSPSSAKKRFFARVESKDFAAQSLK